MQTEYRYPKDQMHLMGESGAGDQAISENSSQRRRHLFKKPPINWLLTTKLFALSALTIVVVAYAAWGLEEPSTVRLATPPPSAPNAPVAAPIRPAESVIENRPAPAPAPAAAPAFAVDDGGFVNTKARCEEGASAVAIGRTERSLVAVCKLRNGSLRYDGIRLRDGAALRLNDVNATRSGFVARNDGVTYTVSSKELLVTEGNQTVSRDAMLDYRAPRLAP